MEKAKVMLVISSVAAIGLGFYAYTTIRRRRKKTREGLECCPELNDKPQNSFRVVLVDNSYSQFKNLKRDDSETENCASLHPYENEINVLLDHPSFPQEIALISEQARQEDSYVWINTLSDLEVLADLLSKEEIFAVDTEQHSLHSFLGFTALMQISTQKKDYLLDTVALHDVMSILRPVFKNPSICKVFHGADNDVVWLQRDFHIYVVNLFDTKKACEVLSKPQKSLAYLLETYCGVAANKALQRADWRLRPLPEEMVQYACDDVHYLLYIAGCLVKELRQKTISSMSGKCNGLHTPCTSLSCFDEAIRRSNIICLQLYAKDLEVSPGDSAATSILLRFAGEGPVITKGNDNVEQLVRQLCRWRDLMARMHDESIRCILSDQSIWALATEVPKSKADIYHVIAQADSKVDASDAYASLPSPSSILCNHVKDVYHLIQEDMSNLDHAFKKILAQYFSAGQGFVLTGYEDAFPEFSSKLNLQRNGGKLRQDKRKASRKLFVQKFSCKAPVYHNCRIYASDGRLLCYCDQRKLDWYLRKDLARLVEHDPPAIMLLFEPKGRPEDEDNDFYIQSKKNMCVGCGERNHYLRYRIIPSCYRVHFPEHLKSHRSHDIVLLCVDCHEVAHAAAEKYKNLIAEEFGVPLFVQKIQELGDEYVSENSVVKGKSQRGGVSPLQLRTAAMALLRHGSKMPTERHEELTLVVKEYFGGREISRKDLETALLVGMSPHERRRLKKKRGLSHKCAAATCDTRAVINSIDDHNLIDDVHALEDLNIEKIINQDFPNGMNTHACDISVYSDNYIDPSACRSSNSSHNMKCLKGVEMEDGDLGAETCNHENEGSVPTREELNVVELSVNVPSSSKHTQKLSLLGHGHHGKKVVETIMKIHGDDGIREFCHRWRQVFVDAIHPRFLPAGWDIKHSGRREFGEYSVYNPSRKL